MGEHGYLPLPGRSVLLQLQTNKSLSEQLAYMLSPSTHARMPYMCGRFRERRKGGWKGIAVAAPSHWRLRGIIKP